MLNDTWELTIDEHAHAGWSRVACEVNPAARSGHAMVWHPDSQGGSVYLFGGDGSACRFNDLWQFRLATKTWTQIPTSETPLPRCKHSMVCVGDDLLVFGGWDWEQAFGSWLRLRLPTEPSDAVLKWESIDTASPIPARIWHSCTLLSTPQESESGDGGWRSLVVFAGEDHPGQYLRNEAFECRVGEGEALTLTCSQLSATGSCAPIERYGHAACAVTDTTICVFGGYAGSSTVLNDISLFSLPSRRWHSSIPRNSEGHALPQVFGATLTNGGDGHLYLFGGLSIHMTKPNRLFQIRVIADPALWPADNASAPGVDDDDWACELCTTVNRKQLSACAACETPRSGAKVCPLCEVPNDSFPCHFCGFEGEAA